MYRGKLITYMVVIFIIMIYCLVYKAKLERKMKEKYEEKIKTVTEEYERKYAEQQSKINSLTQNNIVKTVTVFKPTGEKIVTRVVDKSIKDLKINKKATIDIERNVVGQSEDSIRRDAEVESGYSSSSPHIIVGLGNVQQLESQFSDNSLIFGVKIPYTSISLLSQFKPVKDFYKNLALSVIYEF